MHIKLKYKFLFALFSGLAFTVLNSLTTYFFLGGEFNWWPFGFNFIFFGFFFGFGLLYIMTKTSDRLMKKIEIEIADGESMIHEGPANLFRGIESVGGKLLLSDKRLVFKSHKMNIQSGETQFMAAEIKKAIPRKTAKIFRNGIRIITNSGEYFDFVVYERHHWVMKINKPA